MDDQDFDTAAPYDNMEFPVRKPGTGTWPGPATSSGSGVAGVKLYGHQTIGRSGGGSKLAPLVEVDYSEGSDNNRLQNMSFGNKTTTSSQQVPIQVLNKSTNQMAAPSSNVVTSLDVKETAILDVVATSEPVSSNTNTVSTISPATSTAVTIPSSAQSGKQEVDKNRKPPAVAVNDLNTYVSSEQERPTTDTRKKTLKQSETEEDDFKRQDLNPDARLALERVYTRHEDFYHLNTKVLEEGSLLKQDVLDIYRRSGETLTYEQLLQGMLVDGERFLLSNCWLYYTSVQFLDVEGARTLREPYGRGRVGLTSKRALFLSTETYTGASLEQFDQPGSARNKRQSNVGYKLEVSKCSAVAFKNIPLSNFHSAEMEVVTGCAVQTKITKRSGCCGCLGMFAGKWESTPPMTRSLSSRVLRVGVSMPPWQTRMFLDIHLDPTMSLTVARDFISQLHAFAPHMH